MKKYIGIDPGLNGGIALLSDNGIKTYNMPEQYPDIYELLLEIKEENKDDELIAILEDVGHGVPGQSSKATATFARHNGHLEMALYSLCIRTVKVTPQKWQKFFSNTLGNEPSAKKEKKEWKNKLKALAAQMYPNSKPTLYTADAILIADYGKHMVM